MSLKQHPVWTEPLPGAGRSPDRNHRTNSASVGKNLKPWVKGGTLEDKCVWELPPEPEGFWCWGHSRFMATLKWDMGMCRCFLILVFLIVTSKDKQSCFPEVIAPVILKLWRWEAASRDQWVRGAVVGFLPKGNQNSWMGSSHGSTQASVLSLMVCSSYQRTGQTDVDVPGGSGNSLATSK